MSTKIRLSRAGSKKRPFYRIVVAESSRARDGRFIEKVGHYNPMLPKDRADRLEFNAERIQYWISKGAIPSERVLTFINGQKLCQDAKVVKELNKKHQAVVSLKAVEIEAKKKAEAEAAKAKAAAEAAALKKAEEEAKAKAAEEAAAAEAAAAEAPAATEEAAA